MVNLLNIFNFKICELLEYIFRCRNIFLILKVMILICIICYYFDVGENFIRKLLYIVLEVI